MTVWEASKNHSRNNDERSLWSRPVVWLNLLCLDAPLIAVSWKWLFARDFGVAISGPATQALFLTAWLIYAADRLADATSLASSDPKSLRHQFCLDHRRIWLVVIVLIALADAWIVLTRLDRELFQLGLIFGPLAAVYLAVNARFNRIWRFIPVKECLVGCMFALGTLFVPASRLVHVPAMFVLAGILFAFLCSLNCISIAVWERELDHGQAKHSIATQWNGAALLARGGPAVLALLCLALAFVVPNHRFLFACLGASAVLVSALHFVALRRDERTALADLVLLTPCLVMLGNLR